MEEQHDLANFDPAIGATAEPNNVSDHNFPKAAPARASDLEAETAAGAEAEQSGCRAASSGNRGSSNANTDGAVRRGLPRRRKRFLV